MLNSNFPNLSKENAKITSPKDPDYNCIAHAAGESSEWWWPSDVDYWPRNVARECTKESFCKAFGTLGFQEHKGLLPDNGYDVVALYAIHDVPTHMARRLDDGKWTSKLGRSEDIEHNDVGDIEGPLYGRAVLYLIRPRI